MLIVRIKSYDFKPYKFQKNAFKEDVHLGTFLKKLNSTFLNNMGSEIVSLGVWGSKEIIYHYDFIPSSTLFRSMKLCTKRRNQKIRHSEFFEHFSENWGLNYAFW